MKTVIKASVVAILFAMLAGCYYEPYGYVRGDGYYGDAYYGTGYYDGGYYGRYYGGYYGGYYPGYWWGPSWNIYYYNRGHRHHGDWDNGHHGNWNRGSGRASNWSQGGTRSSPPVSRPAPPPRAAPSRSSGR